MTHQKPIRFTPGPWKVTSRGHDGHIRVCVVDAEGTPICVLPKRPNRRRDALLISVTPELFGALDTLLREVMFHRWEGDQFAIRQAKAALVKGTQKKAHH